MSDFKNDQELKAFLQQHQPKPPAADEGELQAIFTQIERMEEKQSQAYWPRFLFWGAPLVAAAAILFVLLGPVRESAEPLVQDASVTASDSDWGFLEEAADQEVGEDYLQLAGLGE